MPTDNFSIDNAVISSNSKKRWPLMIDPQSQGNKWIRLSYRDEKLQILKLTDSKLSQYLTNGIRMGQPVLL